MPVFTMTLPPPETMRMPMSATVRPTETLPKKMLIALWLLVGIVVAAVTAARITEQGISSPAAGTSFAERTLRFEDRADGGINILDGKSGAKIAQVEPGTNGFLRSTLRGLARERKRRELGSEAPFILALQSNSRLTLTDPATERAVDLGSFGPTNAAVFRGILDGGNSPSSSPGIINLQR
jgi:putative photosynthetic complex assembly protein